MNELIIKTQTMSSKEIAKLTNKNHSDVIRDIRLIFSELYEIKDDANLHHELKQYLNIEFDNRNYMSCVNLNKEQTYTLITGYSVKLRNAIIVRWQELEQATAPRTPVTYLQALKELVAITEQKEQLEAQNRALMHTLNTYTSTQIAKELQFKSANEFNQALHSKGIQYKQNGTWLLYAKYANMGLVEIKQGIKNEHTYYNTHWTQKGRQFLLALFDKI